jgi:nucleotide-binding universal stress UspA family protein
MLDKVLLPIDFGELSMRMFDCALELRELGSKNLILFHVVPKGQTITPENRKKLDELEDRLKAIGMHVDAIIKPGDPVDQIVAEADMEHVDMIAMASGGKSRAEAFFVGSVSFGVIRKTSKPILLDKFPVLPDGELSRECRLGQHLFRNALITMDLPACSQNVERMFDTLCEKGLSRATLFHVIDSSKFSVSDDEHFKGVKNQLESIKNQARGGDCEIKTHVHYGTTAYNILEVIREIDASIVVIGTKTGRSAGLALGTTAEEVVRKALIPLLVVPC